MFLPGVSSRTRGSRAAIAAMTGDQQNVADARAHYRENIVAATALLDSRGIEYLQPAGTFYLWVRVDHVSGGDVAEWAESQGFEQPAPKR